MDWMVLLLMTIDPLVTLVVKVNSFTKTQAVKFSALESENQILIVYVVIAKRQFFYFFYFVTLYECIWQQWIEWCHRSKWAKIVFVFILMYKSFINGRYQKSKNFHFDETLTLWCTDSSENQLHHIFSRTNYTTKL